MDTEESPTKRNNSWFLEFSFIGKVFRRGGKLYFQSYEEEEKLYFQSLDFEGFARSRRG